MSYLLRGLLSSVGLEIPGGDIVISSGTITTAFLVGTIVTLLSSIMPAIRASRIAPIAALRDIAVDRTGSSVKRTISGLALAALGVVGFAAGMVAEDGGDAVKLLSIGSLGVILGVFVLGPVIARPAMQAFGIAPALVSGTTGRLARSNASRNPRRTAATAAALMVGVTLVGFITILATSTKASIGAAVDRSLRADYVVDSGTGFGNGGLSPAIEAALDGLPEVEALSPLRSAPVGIDGGTTELYAFDAADIDTFLEIEPSSGSFADIVGGGIAVGSDTAAQHDLEVGDVVTIRFAATGEQSLEVRAIYTERDLFGSPMLVDVPVFEANIVDQFDHQVWLTTADGVDAETSGAAITSVLEAWPNAELQDQAAFKESLTKEIDQMLNLIYGLLALAVIIALIGIANTLALSVHERRRELGLLRAVGMSRRQVRTAIRWESVLISILGTAFGFVLAVGMAWGIVTALGNEGVTSFVIPGAQLAVIVGLATVAGVIAAVGPARRAARLNVLDAIATA
jgi:putative ABC transport system permease protein